MHKFQGGKIICAMNVAVVIVLIAINLQALNVQQSFSHAGTPYDNSVCESFFHTMKNEEIYHHLYSSEADLKLAIEEYLTFYNSQRPHRKLNMQTPVSFETGFYHFIENHGKASGK